MAKPTKSNLLVYAHWKPFRFDALTVKRLNAIAPKGQRSETIRRLISEEYARQVAAKVASNPTNSVL